MSNVITKPSTDTQGTLLSGGAGNHEQAMTTVRHGTQFNASVYGRFYLNRHDQNAFEFSADGADAHDNRQIISGGFRCDGDVGFPHAWTLQGDLYHGENNDRQQPPRICTGKRHIAR